MTLSPATMDAPPGARARARPRRVSGWAIMAGALALLFAFPVAMVCVMALAPTGDVWRHLAETVLARYVTNSLALMVGVGAGTFAIGVSCAWLVTMCRFPGRRVFEWALFLPMAVPAYVLAYTYTGLLDVSGPLQTGLRHLTGWTVRDYWFPPVRSLGGAVAMLTLVLYPYVYLLARAAFLEQSVCVLEIGRTLGRSAWSGFFRLALPLARPAIVTGVALAMMETLGDFGTVQYFAVDTFTTGIFRTWLGMGDPAAAAQLAAILLVFIALCILLERRSRRDARFHHTSTRYRPLPRYELRGGRAMAATLACLTPIVLGFVAPALQLALWAWRGADQIDGRFFAVAGNSLLLAGLTAIAAVVLAVLLAYGMRLGATRFQRIATRAAGLGYAVPGSVVAVGVLVPFAWTDNVIDAWTRATFGVSVGLILSGTIFALVFAYLVRFLAIAFNTVEASLGKVTPSMDAAARSLGKSPAETLWRVHLPMVGGSLLTAGLLVFVDVMKELPATLIMRPFDFDTLAVKAFELASDERLAEAALPALAIVAVGIIPVILLSRAISRARPGAHPIH
jgi:iron(III) transport system permease protein